MKALPIVAYGFCVGALDIFKIYFKGTSPRILQKNVLSPFEHKLLVVSESVGEALKSV
jgi:hypothetical protein